MSYARPSDRGSRAGADPPIFQYCRRVPLADCASRPVSDLARPQFCRHGAGPGAGTAFHLAQDDRLTDLSDRAGAADLPLEQPAAALPAAIAAMGAGGRHMEPPTVLPAANCHAD